MKNLRKMKDCARDEVSIKDDNGKIWLTQFPSGRLYHDYWGVYTTTTADRLRATSIERLIHLFLDPFSVSIGVRTILNSNRDTENLPPRFTFSIKRRMYQNLNQTCIAIVLLKTFACWRSRCRCRRGMREKVLSKVFCSYSHLKNLPEHAIVVY